jgi:GNAT superfamily N-acetyltransferase
MITQFMITLFLGTQLLNFPDHYFPGWLALFKEYPILNQGTVEGVKDQFEKFSQESHFAVLISETDERILTGLLTGIPLAAYYEPELFQKNNLDPAELFLINDLIVLPGYRKQGIASKLYNKLEKKASKLWGYKKICVCTIDHKDDHPLKPSNYHDSASFWKQQGFSMTSIKIEESWPTIIDDQGNVEMCEHTLTFWYKDLEANSITK